MSYASSYSYLYAHPDNAALREQVRAEHLNAAMRRAGHAA